MYFNSRCTLLPVSESGQTQTQDISLLKAGLIAHKLTDTLGNCEFTATYRRVHRIPPTSFILCTPWYIDGSLVHYIIYLVLYIVSMTTIHCVHLSARVHLDLA